jgi:hypothetical protein
METSLRGLQEPGRPCAFSIGHGVIQPLQFIIWLFSKVCCYLSQSSLSVACLLQTPLEMLFAHRHGICCGNIFIKKKSVEHRQDGEICNHGFENSRITSTLK